MRSFKKRNRVLGGKPVDEDKLKASDFVLSKERKFPIVTPQSVSDAVSSWGRYKGETSFEDFKKRLITMAKRKGADFVNALPKDWREELKCAMQAFNQDVPDDANEQDDEDEIVDPDEDDEDYEFDEQAKAAHKYSTTQVELPDDIAGHIKAFGAAIDDDHLHDKGLEDKPHITVKYGLHTNDHSEVAKTLADEPPIKATFGKTSVFPAAETGADYDVIKCAVKSADLERLNKKIAANHENTTSFKNYLPHATIGYVKAGMGAKYAGKDFLNGKMAEFKSVTFADKSRNKHVIPLGSAKDEYAMATIKTDDISVFDSYEIKANGVNGVEGYLVKFGSPDKTDVTPTRDFFSPTTDFDATDGKSMTMYYQHGQDPVMGLMPIGKGSIKQLSDGIYFKGSLDLEGNTWTDEQRKLRGKYLKELQKRGISTKSVMQLVRDGELGFSSGTASHLVERKSYDNGSHEITKWPLGLDASLTPNPAEPRNSVQSIKSAMTNAPTLENLIDNETKSYFDNALTGQTVNQDAWNFINAFQTGYANLREDIEEGEVEDPKGEFQNLVRDFIQKIYFALLPGITTSDDSTGKSLKFADSTTNLTALIAVKSGLPTALRFADHSALALSTTTESVEEVKLLANGLKQFVDRAKGNLEWRREFKSGRTLSSVNHDKVKQIHEGLTQAQQYINSIAEQVSNFMELAKPKPADTDNDRKDDDEETLSAKSRKLKNEYLREMAIAAGVAL